MQPLRVFARNLLPGIYNRYKKKKIQKIKDELSKQPKISEEKFRSILTENLDLREGDTVFIHSSYNRIRPDFGPQELIDIILEIVGEDGTIAVPSYPPMNSVEFLKSGQKFDVNNTPSRTGIITELIRKDPRSKRSLHPIKPVSAIGKNAKYLIKDHHRSPYPYDINSPYYRIIELDGKYIGLGLNSYFIASLHCVDDILKEKYPVNPYHKKLFKAECIDENGKEVVVKTYAHTLVRTDYNMHTFVKKHISEDICKDIIVEGREFYTARMKPLHEEAMKLARKNITIYPRSSYKLKFFFK